MTDGVGTPKRGLRVVVNRTVRATKKQPQYLSVRDLEKWQHYKTRNPPWIKLHWALLDDPDYLRLTETDRHRYVMCVVIASRCENRILNDPSYLAKLMRLSDPVDLTALIDSGLLLAWRKQPASNALASRKQNAPSETERETETETEKRRGGLGENHDRRMVGMGEDRDLDKAVNSERQGSHSQRMNGFESVGSIKNQILKAHGFQV